MKYEFVHHEANTISDGILRLIADACEAKRLVSGSMKCKKVLNEYIAELKNLNTKICKEA